MTQESGARERAKLLPCPFCGSTNIDPEGWVSTSRSGPACDDCVGSADTVERWNTRSAPPCVEAAGGRVPDGWKLVPVEPTPAMIEAAADFHANGKWDVSDDSVFGGIYKAMLENAPKIDVALKGKADGNVLYSAVPTPPAETKARPSDPLKIAIDGYTLSTQVTHNWCRVYISPPDSPTHCVALTHAKAAQLRDYLNYTLPASPSPGLEGK